MKKTLLIIDGHNFLFKAYGVPFKFHSANGTPLHVVTTYLGLIRRAVKCSECSDIAIVFDTEFKTSNHNISEDYKANRKMNYSQDEDSPFRHMPFIKIVLKFLKIKAFEKRGTEADDIIASLATQYLKENKNGKILIASSDSDFYQLLSKNVSLIHFGKKGLNTFFTPVSLQEKYGITPKQYVLFKSLTGDSSDNIKGVPGIGPIRASKIVNKTIPFDMKEIADLLKHNERLVKLNTQINVCKKLDILKLDSKIEKLKNADIFLKLKF